MLVLVLVLVPVHQDLVLQEVKVRLVRLVHSAHHSHHSSVSFDEQTGNTCKLGSGLALACSLSLLLLK